MARKVAKKKKTPTAKASPKTAPEFISAGGSAVSVDELATEEVCDNARLQAQVAQLIAEKARLQTQKDHFERALRESEERISKMLYGVGKDTCGESPDMLRGMLAKAREEAERATLLLRMAELKVERNSAGILQARSEYDGYRKAALELTWLRDYPMDFKREPGLITGLFSDDHDAGEDYDPWE